MASEPPAPRKRQYTYLPFLTWSLLALLVAYFLVWFLFYRPSGEERLQTAAFSQALGLIPEAYVGQVDRAALYQGAMKGMVAALKDRYSWYLSPAQLTRLGEDTKGEFGGIGVVLTQSAGKVLVEEVLKDGPAARAGIEAGDLLARVDGEETAGLPLERIVSLVRGEVGSSVTLDLVRAATGQALTCTVVREAIRAPNVEHEMIEDHVGVLRVAAFDETCSEEVRQALLEMKDKGMEGLLLDLRGNSGGLVKQATQVCDMFLDSGRILAIKGRQEPPEPPVDATPGTVLPVTDPVVVLVDRRTASAAEIVAGTLQATGRGTVVGTRTVGKGAVTSVMRLSDGSGLLLTVAHYELADGRIIEGKGIQPDVAAGELPPLPEGLDERAAREWLHQEREKARKNQLDRGLQVLREKLR